MFRTFHNDIAILEMDNAVRFNRHIRPICLPNLTPELMKDDLVNQTVSLSGWGSVKFRGMTYDSSPDHNNIVYYSHHRASIKQITVWQN